MYFDVHGIGKWEVAVPLGALQGVPFSHNVCTGTCIGMCLPQGGEKQGAGGVELHADMGK